MHIGALSRSVIRGDRGFAFVRSGPAFILVAVGPLLSNEQFMIHGRARNVRFPPKADVWHYLSSHRVQRVREVGDEVVGVFDPD